MTKLPLRLEGEDRALRFLTCELPPQPNAVSVEYETPAGALLRVDGETAGAFDREHVDVALPPSPRTRVLTFEVERNSLPTNGLPSGPGLRWRSLLARSHPKAQPFALLTQNVAAKPPLATARADTSRIPVVGHSHLDVAWLWSFDQTRRKAQRTFAIACDLLARDAGFLFAQSQPQLFAYVEEDDPRLFVRMQELVKAGRFDPRIAATWVEPDCNLPSGESLLRQLFFGHRYCVQRFGIEPDVAWLPDSFGFANTLPMLLAHAGIDRFVTTKLQWNDTTRFPYAQFRWRAPDGSEVLAALIASYDGGLDGTRVRVARQRNEPVVAGYGDGGGGVTPDMLAGVAREGRWVRPSDWMDELQARRQSLPAHAGELYLEYHRGVYTTHHDVKSANALLERALALAEELAAWCAAVGALPALRASLLERLNAAWEIVLRNQFHDVLPGTSIAEVYAHALDDYARAGEIAAGAVRDAQHALPRAASRLARSAPLQPHLDEGDYIFQNEFLVARVAASGAIAELRTAAGKNLCAQANALALYTDRPKNWEAWNVDAGYERRMRRAKPQGARPEDGALAVRLLLGRSPATMRIALCPGEPFLRVDLQVDWRERRTLLRVENWLTLRSDRATYGSPHGAVVRTMGNPAQYEVPGQRFAMVGREDDAGVALLALDTYGWSARALKEGGVRLGHSLLRGTCWPDERADLGEAVFSYAFMPLDRTCVSVVEEAWLRFANEPLVRLFTSADVGVLVAACKPAEDGDGVIVRVRECDGRGRDVALRCGARAREARCVDGLERPVAGDVRIDGESLRFALPAYGLRSFRVRFGYA